jgi:hypothetical protein
VVRLHGKRIPDRSALARAAVPSTAFPSIIEPAAGS